MKRKEKKMVKSDVSNKFTIFLALVFLVYIVDRYTKVLSAFVYGCFLFCMKRSVNYGAAFNLLQGFQWTRVLLIAVALAVLIITAYFYFKVRGRSLLHFGLIFFFAGTFCNMLDRIIYGYVIDWLTLSFIPLPAFNVADLSNIVGVVFLIIVLLKKK